jgi:hypothetical protein
MHAHTNTHNVVGASFGTSYACREDVDTRVCEHTPPPGPPRPPRIFANVHGNIENVKILFRSLDTVMECGVCDPPYAINTCTSLSGMGAMLAPMRQASAKLKQRASTFKIVFGFLTWFPLTLYISCVAFACTRVDGGVVTRLQSHRCRPSPLYFLFRLCLHSCRWWGAGHVFAIAPLPLCCL